MQGAIGLNHFLLLSLVIFSLGMVCVLTRRNAIGILMGVELILNSANINYLAFAFYGGGKYDGQIFAIFVIMLAAAEAVIGLAVVLARVSAARNAPMRLFALQVFCLYQRDHSRRGLRCRGAELPTSGFRHGRLT